MVDLFCGAGGLAAGFASAGFDVSLASDCWAPAAATYRQNFPDHAFAEVDIRDVGPNEILEACGGQPPLVIAGGPPCQGFSSAGARDSGDERNSLVGHYARLATFVRPEVIVFENVEGFLTAGGGTYVFDLLDPLIDAGYSVRLDKLNVANFGVPQLRKRVIVIATLGRSPVALRPTHSASGAPGVWRVGAGLPHTVTVAEALADLVVSGKDDLAEPRWPQGIESARVKALRQGQTMRDLPEELQHASWALRANRRVSDGTPSERRGGAPVGLRRLVANEPSKAITGAATREFVHPTQDRTITLREAACLQTFPDGFAFVGSKADTATMIGNAIPPRFAEQLAHAVKSTLDTPAGAVDAELEAFNVTNAEACSPALMKVINVVAHRYPRQSSLQLF